jgi:hypothetical protein
VDKIIAKPQELALEIARLDPQGWNTDRKIHPITSQRAVMMLFRIREEILEVALRVRVQNLQLRMRRVFPATCTNKRYVKIVV